MGKLEAFSVAGLEIFFLSLDHRPPHLHVNNPGVWEIRVYFMECTETHLEFDVKWNKKTRILTKNQKREFLEKICTNRKALLDEWDEKVCEN